MAVAVQDWRALGSRRSQRSQGGARAGQARGAVEGDPAVVGGHAPGLRGGAPLDDDGDRGDESRSNGVPGLGRDQVHLGPRRALCLRRRGAPPEIRLRQIPEPAQRRRRRDDRRLLGRGGHRVHFRRNPGLSAHQLAIDHAWPDQSRANGRAPQVGVEDIRAARTRRQRCRAPRPRPAAARLGCLRRGERRSTFRGDRRSPTRRCCPRACFQPITCSGCSNCPATP